MGISVHAAMPMIQVWWKRLYPILGNGYRVIADVIKQIDQTRYSMMLSRRLHVL
jgi:hypothetical protein